MKKYFLVTLLLITSITYGEIAKQNFSIDEFSDDTYIIRYNPNNENLLEPKELKSQHYNFEIEDKDKEYLMRYILFSDVGVTDNYKEEFTLWSYMVLNNILGDEKQVKNSSWFNDADVKSEFNADLGFTNFAIDIKTDYGNDYRFIMTNFFYKKGLGIMCQTIQFNDIEFSQSEGFMDYFHGFNFK